MTEVIDIRDGSKREVGDPFHEDADRVLDKAKTHLADVLIIGIDKEGEVWMSGTFSHVPQISFLLDRVKHFLLTGDFV